MFVANKTNEKREAERKSVARNRWKSQRSIRPADVQGLIQQTREPQFVSSAYFLRFKFEQGRYALVGRESFDDRQVLANRVLPDPSLCRRGRPPRSVVETIGRPSVRGPQA